MDKIMLRTTGAPAPQCEDIIVLDYKTIQMMTIGFCADVEAPFQKECRNVSTRHHGGTELNTRTNALIGL